MATTKNTKTTSTSTSSSKGPTKAELEAKNASLEAQIAELKELILKQQQATGAAAAPAAAPVAAPQNITFTVPDTNVSVVYCSDSLGHAAISNMELNFNRYGEEFVMSRSQFDELVGKYRRWFDNGILAVSSKNLDVAVAKGLSTDAELAFDAKTLQSLGSMTPAQIEELWNRTTKKAHRDSIVTYYKRKFIEGDEAYLDRAKVDLLNRLTAGGFAREQDELGGRYKISPTEM